MIQFLADDVGNKVRHFMQLSPKWSLCQTLSRLEKKKKKKKKIFKLSADFANRVLKVKHPTEK